MRILLAPDKFRGTLTAPQAAEAMAAGWRRERPGDDLELVPMADGGEGTMDTLIAALGGRVRRMRVAGPLGDPVDSVFGIAEAPGDESPDDRIGIVEMAQASGLALVSRSRRDPLRTSTRGTGELMAGAIDAGATRLVVCLGGSATNDGGAGMAVALGARFLDGAGRAIADGGAALVGLARIDLSSMHPKLGGVSVSGACDVDNPLTGPRGASAVYGPQKGASPEDVSVLDHALGHLAAVVERDLGVALKDEPGAGAAGGLGFGLMAFCGAGLRPGVEVVSGAVGLAERIARADLVITGEGSLDEQSLRGKVPAGVLAACELAGVPAAIVCGQASIEPPGVPVIALADRVGLDTALTDPRGALVDALEDLASRAPALAAARP
ncbi:MAG: glycerate kinase [Actinomycetota bacterium]